MKVPDDKLCEFYQTASEEAKNWYWYYVESFPIPTKEMAETIAVLMGLAFNEGREYEKKERDDALYAGDIDRRGQKGHRQNRKISEADC